MNRYQKSYELYQRACQSLAGGVASEFRKFGYPHPLFYERGVGSRVYDVDGNEYLDFTLSQGPLILGHSHPEVLRRVTESSQAGQLYAGQHLEELELAETLQRLIPCAELMRFSLSGSEADHAALRLARAVTGKQKYLKFEGHYHGWFDSVSYSISAASEAALGSREQPNIIPWTQGLPANGADDLLVLPWNDLELAEKTIRQHAHELSAVITSPAMCNAGCIAPRKGFLQGLRDVCSELGIVLIFDEVIIGFRLGMAGGQGYFGVVPDLAVFGKAMASGYPISVLAGKRQFMEWIADGRVIHAGTMNSGNPSIAAATATISVLEQGKVHDHLFELGRELMEGLRDASRRAGQPLLVQGFGPAFHAGFSPLEAVYDFRDTLSYDKAKYSKFMAGMHDRGVRLIGRGIWYLSAAHTSEDARVAIDTAYDVLKAM